MKFEYTADGYRRAVTFLKAIGEYKNASTSGFPTDGYSIVAYANSCFEQMMKHTMTHDVEEV